MHEPPTVSHMYETISWRAYIRATDRPSAERVVSRLGVQLDRAVRIDSYERYWKIPEFAEMRLTSPLQRSAPETALLSALRSAWRIATPWTLNTPGPADDFEAIASATAGSHFLVPGIEWMQFRISAHS